MKHFNFMGRSDGLGNRIEEIILLEAICAKEKNITVDYIWNNQHIHRSYNILLSSKNVSILQHPQDSVVFCKLQDFPDSLSQSELLAAASNIKPRFNIAFDKQIKPVGVHIRGTDRIGKNHPHYMKNNKELNEYLSKTIELINHAKPEYVFICADDVKVKNEFIKHLNREIVIVEPICDKSIPLEYRDFFALTLCSKIYMCSRFSTFSIIASLIGNIPLVSYVYDETVLQRYKALFEYELDFNNIRCINIVRDNQIGTLIKKLKLKMKDIFQKCTV
ncbi:hypothetical protein FACS1894182_06470 [Bacteroidia bacterium]|nr:hypothetical protein FACS1894182_06470 [Bacteroidia bacterium]